MLWEVLSSDAVQRGEWESWVIRIGLLDPRSTTIRNQRYDIYYEKAGYGYWRIQYPVLENSPRKVLLIRDPYLRDGVFYSATTKWNPKVEADRTKSSSSSSSSVYWIAPTVEVWPTLYLNGEQPLQDCMENASWEEICTLLRRVTCLLKNSSRGLVTLQ